MNLRESQKERAKFHRERIRGGRTQQPPANFEAQKRGIASFLLTDTCSSTAHRTPSAELRPLGPRRTRLRASQSLQTGHPHARAGRQLSLRERTAFVRLFPPKKAAKEELPPLATPLPHLSLSRERSPGTLQLFEAPRPKDLIRPRFSESLLASHTVPA